jgi:hypothetical protein
LRRQSRLHESLIYRVVGGTVLALMFLLVLWALIDTMIKD